MLALHDARTQQLHRRLGPAALVRAGLDAAAAIGSLLASVLWFGGRMDGACLILALLVFALTYPSNPARETADAKRLARDILAEWLAIAALLLLLGWASRTLDAFDTRALSPPRGCTARR